MNFLFLLLRKAARERGNRQSTTNQYEDELRHLEEEKRKAEEKRQKEDAIMQQKIKELEEKKREEHEREQQVCFSIGLPHHFK